MPRSRTARMAKERGDDGAPCRRPCRGRRASRPPSGRRRRVGVPARCPRRPRPDARGCPAPAACRLSRPCRVVFIVARPEAHLAAELQRFRERGRGPAPKGLPGAAPLSRCARPQGAKAPDHFLFHLGGKVRVDLFLVHDVDRPFHKTQSTPRHKKERPACASPAAARRADRTQ